MVVRILALVSAAAWTLALAPAPAAAQHDTVTVRYTWLAPPAAARSAADAALMLACPRGDPGPAYLSVVQPLSEAELSGTYLFQALERSGRELFYARLGSTDAARQAALNVARAALAAGRDTVLTGPGGSLRLVHVAPADTAAVPAAALEGFPRTLTLANECSAGLPEPLLVGDVLNGGMGLGRLVQAGEYVFARRLAGAASTPADRLENALVGLLDAAARSRGSVPQECESPAGTVMTPLASADAVRARRWPVKLVRSDTEGRPWLVANGTLRPQTLDVKLAIAPDSARLRVAGEEQVLEVPPCGQREVVLVARGGALTDGLEVAQSDSLLTVTISPAATASGAARVATVSSTGQGLRIVVQPDGGWGKWLPWLGAGALLLGVLGWLLYRLRRQRARERRFADQAVYFAPDEIRHPVELALALQGVSREPLPSAVAGIRDSLPRRLRKFALPDANWRLGLWAKLKDNGTLNRLRNDGWAYYSVDDARLREAAPGRKWRARRRSEAEDKFQLSSLDEAVTVYAVQRNPAVLDQLSEELRKDVLRFPDNGDPPPGLREELADAVNRFREREGWTGRESLERALPRFLTPEQPPVLAEVKAGAGGDDAHPATPPSSDALSGEAGNSGSTVEPGAPPSPFGAQPAAPPIETPPATVHAFTGEIGGLLGQLRDVVPRLERTAGLLAPAEQLEHERRRASELDARGRALGERLQGMTGRVRGVLAVVGGGTGGEEFAFHGGDDDAVLLRDLEGVPARLEALYRQQEAQIYRQPDGEPRAPRGLSVLDRFGRLERLAAEHARLRAETPRAARIAVLAAALDDAGQALGALGDEPSVLENTDLVPRALSARLRAAGAEIEAQWHAALLSAAEAAVDHGAAADPAELHRRFMTWLLENDRAQLLTHTLRLREVIRVYCRDAAAPEARDVHALGTEYVHACDGVVQALRGLGVYLDPISFLKPPPDQEERRFEAKWGRPGIFDSRSLREIVVSRVRGAPGELSDTIADVSDWGYACPGLPLPGKPTRGWLCRGLDEL